MIQIRIAVIQHSGQGDQLEMAVRTVNGLTCAGTFYDPEQALRGLKRDPADVLLLHIRGPGFAEDRHLRALKRMVPSLKIIVCSAMTDGLSSLSALMAGADGILTNPITAADIAAAVRAVCRNETPISPSVAQHLVQVLRTSGWPTAASAELLTPRELEIMEFVARGLLAKEIADSLSLSVLTVKRHLHNAYSKLHVENRVEAINRLRSSHPGWPESMQAHSAAAE